MDNAGSGILRNPRVETALCDHVTIPPSPITESRQLGLFAGDLEQHAGISDGARSNGHELFFAAFRANANRPSIYPRPVRKSSPTGSAGPSSAFPLAQGRPKEIIHRASHAPRISPTTPPSHRTSCTFHSSGGPGTYLRQLLQLIQVLHRKNLAPALGVSVLDAHQPRHGEARVVPADCRLHLPGPSNPSHHSSAMTSPVEAAVIRFKPGTLPIAITAPLCPTEDSPRESYGRPSTLLRGGGRG